MADTNHSDQYLLCIDLGSSSIKTTICAPNGDIASRASMPFTYEPSELDGDLGKRYHAERVLSDLSWSVKNVVDRSGVHPNQIAGCAINSQRHGPVDVPLRLIIFPES